MRSLVSDGVVDGHSVVEILHNVFVSCCLTIAWRKFVRRVCNVHTVQGRRPITNRGATCKREATIVFHNYGGCFTLNQFCLGFEGVVLSIRDSSLM